MAWSSYEDRAHAIQMQIQGSIGETVNCWPAHDSNLSCLQWKCRWLPKEGDGVDLSMMPDRLDLEDVATATARMASAWIDEIRGLLAAFAIAGGTA